MRTVREIFWDWKFQDSDEIVIFVQMPNGEEFSIADVLVQRLPGADYQNLAEEIAHDLGYEKTLPIKEEGHYNDGVIDYREIHCPCPESAFESLVVMVNCEGKSKVIDGASNLFSEQDILDAYDELLDPDWDSEANRKAMKAEFKRYLISQGAEFDD